MSHLTACTACNAGPRVACVVGCAGKYYRVIIECLKGGE